MYIATNTILLFENFLLDLKKIHNNSLWSNIKVKYLGKNGWIITLTKQIVIQNIKKREKLGKKINNFKLYALHTLEKIKILIDNKIFKEQLKKEKIDYSLPGRGYNRGYMHPITYVTEEMKKIFCNLGFNCIEGNEIENKWYNFTALNIPIHHPAREMHDTFYLNKNDMLLRTHTSNIQIRHMEKNKTFPIKIISIGKVYRRDYDVMHTPMFHQLEGLYVGNNVSLIFLKECIEKFLHSFFLTKKISLRFRSSYFPFTEPSFEVDIKHNYRNKDIITFNSSKNWLEIMGFGMVNRKVLTNVGIQNNKIHGMAFGIGIERLAMLKYGINDLRNFFSGDIRWIKHYGL